MKTSDIQPLTSYEVEFERWVGAARAGSDADAQPVVDELRAEHHVLDAVLAAMEREMRRLSVHGDLRPDFWEGVVDYLGNFTYLVHRRKEEEAVFGVLLEAEGLPKDRGAESVRELIREHEQAKSLTMDLVDGVSDGDWEKVLRAAHVYLRVARDHLDREERDLFEPLERLVDGPVLEQLRRDIDVIERDALAERDRLYYLDVARRLCAAAGLPDLLH